jgi:hypothetical protein
MTKPNHSDKFVDMPNSIKYPRWEILQVNIEHQMQRYDAELDKPENMQDELVLSYIRKDVKAMKTELKSLNYLFN